MSVRIITGDALSMLPTLEAGSCQVAITSPPYLGLRDYKHPGQLGLEKTPGEYVEKLVAIFRELRRVLHPTGLLFLNLGDGYASQGGSSGNPDRQINTGQRAQVDAGAIRDAVPNGVPGIPTGSLLGIPHRVAFALQADGWLLRSAIVCTKVAPMPESVAGVRWERCRTKSRYGGAHRNADERDLCKAVPVMDQERAEWTDCPGCDRCRASCGLVLRWGSGRPTSAYEMLFVLAKSATYFWNSEAVRMRYSTATMPEIGVEYNGQNRHDYAAGRAQSPSDAKRSIIAGLEKNGGRNAWNYQRFEDALDVWEWRPEGGFDGPHYATFPVSLPAWCIKAATPERCCSKCGAPYAPVVDRKMMDESRPQARRALEIAREKGLTDAHFAAVRAVGISDTGRGAATQSGTGKNAPEVVALAAEAKVALGGYYREFLLGSPGARDDAGRTHSTTEQRNGRTPPPERGWESSRSVSGWLPTCGCSAPSRPAVVLDPFAGAGTTGLAADRLGRDAVLIELSEEYAKMARARIQRDAPLFAELSE